MSKQAEPLQTAVPAKVFVQQSYPRAFMVGYGGKLTVVGPSGDKHTLKVKRGEMLPLQVVYIVRRESDTRVINNLTMLY